MANTGLPWVQGPAWVIAQKIGLISILAFAITAPWATYRYVPGTTTLIPVVIAEILILTLFISSALRTFLRRASIALLLAQCLVVFSSYTWSIRPLVWRDFFAWWMIGFFVFFATQQFIKSDREFKYLAIASAVAAFVTLPLLNTDAYTHVAEELRRFTVHGHNANHTGYILAGCAYIIVVCLTFMNVRYSVKAILIAGLFAVVIELHLLGTRGAQLSVALVILAAFITSRLPIIFAKIASLGLVIGCVLVSAGMLIPIMVWVDSFSARSTGDLSGRLVLMKDAHHYIIENLWIGIGPGSFPNLSQLGMEAHNLFLSVLLTGGVLGFSVFVLLCVAIWWEISNGTGRVGSRLLLMFLCFITPIALSGHIETIAYLWIPVGFTISLAGFWRQGKRSSTSSVYARHATLPLPKERRNGIQPARETVT